MNRYLRRWLSRFLGDEGEAAAARFLRKRGHRVITRGYRTGRGEIDLITRDGQVLVFVEVKTRRLGRPAEAVNPQKQRRLVLAALQFLRRYDLLEQKCRFDVVAVVWPESARSPQIEHFPNAFEPPGSGQFHR